MHPSRTAESLVGLLRLLSDVKGVGVVRSRATVDVKTCDTPPRVPSRTREVRVDREYTRTSRCIAYLDFGRTTAGLSLRN